MISANYSCVGQMNIFDYLSEVSAPSVSKKDFSWDADINDIHKMLTTLTEDFGLTAKSEWSIWGHVPRYGYRMSFSIDLTEEDYNNDNFLERLDGIVDYAKTKDIELSPFAPVFLRKGECGFMHIFSMFLDRKRQLRKD